MLLQSYFPFPVFLNTKKPFFQQKKNSYFQHLIFAFTKIFVFNDGEITKGEKLSSRGNEFPGVLRNTWLQQIFMGTKKKSKEIQQYSSSCFCFFVCFRGLSIISSVRHFFAEVYPFKNICHMEIFVIVYLLKLSVYWTSSPYISIKSLKL